MPTSDDIVVSVSGRLVHQWDFAFYKNNGEIANRVRTELGSDLKEISLDSDGDIDIRTDQSSYFLTPAGVVVGGWLMSSKAISTLESAEAFVQRVELLARAKGSFRAESFGVRLFFRFTPSDGLKLIGTRGFDGILQSILGDGAPSDVKSYKFSSRLNKPGFSDLIELEASGRDVQLRYSRDSNGSDFDSYRAFLGAAGLAALFESLRPFAEVLVAAQPRSLGRSLFAREKNRIGS